MKSTFNFNLNFINSDLIYKLNLNPKKKMSRLIITNLILTNGFSLTKSTPKINRFIDSLCLLYLVSLQKPFLLATKKFIPSFQLKRNFIIGSKCNLRRYNAYNFCIRLLLALNDLQDFRGVSLCSNNYKQFYVSCGLSNLNFFKEYSFLFESLNNTCGLNVNFGFKSHLSFQFLKCILSWYKIPFFYTKNFVN